MMLILFTLVYILMDEDYNFRFRLLILGNPRTGKTSLISRYTSDSYNNE